MQRQAVWEDSWLLELFSYTFLEVEQTPHSCWPSRKAAVSGVMGIREPQDGVCFRESVRKWPSVCRVAGSQAGTGNLQGDKY